MAFAGFDSSWGELTSQTLRRFLEDSVRISRDDIGQARDVVVPEVERILQGVTEADPRFGCAFQRSGSYIEGLKVSEPDEFDFLVPLMKIPKLYAFLEYIPEELPDASFVPVVLSNKAKKEGIEPGADLTLWQKPDVSVRQGFYLGTSGAHSVISLRNVCAPPGSACAWPISWRMSPEKTMGIFKEYVRDVISRMSGRVTIQRMSQDTPAVTIKIPYNGMEISADLVPFIKNPFNEWSLAWPDSEPRWPSQSKIEEIKSTGVDLVAKHHLFWRYSFSRIERVLLEKIDEDGGHRRDSLRILKKVRQDRWAPKFRKNALVSYHLKNVLFWACELYPDTEQWQDLAKSFKRLVDILIDCLSKGKLPLFFHRRVNLFKAEKEVLNAVLQEVLRFRASPVAYFN